MTRKATTKTSKFAGLEPEVESFDWDLRKLWYPTDRGVDRDAPDPDRIAYIRGNHWVGYDRAIQIKDDLADILGRPTAIRAVGRLISAPSTNGKTWILGRFLAENPPVLRPDGGGWHVPVFIVDCPPSGTEKRLYRRILDLLQVPAPAYYRVEELEVTVYRILRSLGVRMLVLDEVQNLIVGEKRDNQVAINAVKEFMNRLHIPVILAGTEDSEEVINVDNQTKSRFPISRLPLWGNGSKKEQVQFGNLVASFAEFLPLRTKPDLLSDPRIPDLLLLKGEGSIGKVWSVLSNAAVRAIRDPKNVQELITLELIQECEAS